MKTIIVTSIFYPSADASRFAYARELVEKAMEAGYPIIVVNESPDTAIGETLSELGAIVFRQKNKGMGPGRRQAFLEALKLATNYGSKTILWTEPERHTIVPWIPKIIEPLEHGEAAISVPWRTDESWKSYPTFQRASETVGNMVYKESTGMDVDIFTGPLAFTREVSPYFCECDPTEFGAEDTYVQHYALIQAHANGVKVVSVPIDLEYDPRQKAEEEGPKRNEMYDKRFWQTRTLISGYFYASRYYGLLKNLTPTQVQELRRI